jgi:hypothetical protein
MMLGALTVLVRNEETRHISNRDRVIHEGVRPVRRGDKWAGKCATWQADMRKGRLDECFSGWCSHRWSTNLGHF